MIQLRGILRLPVADIIIYFAAVVCLGTEDRVTDPAKMVAANSVVIPFVTFPGAEIKDLIVHDPSTAAVPAPPKQQQNNNRNAQQQRQAQPNRTNPPRPPANNSNNNNANNRRPPQNQQSQQNAQPAAQQAPRREPRADAGTAGTGAHLLKLREKKAPDASENTKTETAGEFDFSAGLDMFKKDDVLATVAGETEVDTKYKKDDFFDTLSSDVKSGADGRKTRMSASEERSLNQDTFGAIALQGNNRRYYQGGRGGAGRGSGRGRGGGRGRGRGYGNGGVPAAKA